MQHPPSIAIIGAGPAGLMAAQVLAESGFAVSIYDRMATPARKLLMAGRGGLNLTHSEQAEAFIPRYGRAAEWLEPYIYEFPPKALRQWCEGLGQETFIGSSGRVFPKAMKAAPLLRAWLRHLDSLGVRFVPHHRWQGWEGAQLLFEDNTGRMHRVQADATLLALGGASWPRLGSDGGWAGILQREGIAVAPLRPANCGFSVAWSEYFRMRYAGQPLKPLAVTYAGERRQGEAMITAQGLEGGVVYALSSRLRDGLEGQGKVSIKLDLRPDMAMDALIRKLSISRGRHSLSSYLKRAGLSPLVIALLHEGVPREQLTSATPETLAGYIKALPLVLTATAGMARAISSAGGVMQEAVDDNLMLRSMPGVFVAGEMLDWEAPTGGYLLQGCFSTAVAAAEGIKRFLTP